MAKNSTCAVAPTAKIFTAQTNVLLFTCSFSKAWVCFRTKGKVKSMSNIVGGVNPNPTANKMANIAIVFNPTNNFKELALPR